MKTEIKTAKINIEFRYKNKNKMVAELTTESPVNIDILIAGLNLLKSQLLFIKKDQGNCEIKDVAITNVF
jgi:hypothetical protein